MHARNPIVLAVLGVALLWGGTALVRRDGSVAPPVAADSTSRDGGANAADGGDFVVTSGRIAAPSEVLVPRPDWPLRGVEVPDSDARGALAQAGLAYGDVGGVFTWRWAPMDGAGGVRPVVLELLVYRTADYDALRRAGRAAPVLVRGRELTVAYHQPRGNPFPDGDPRHAQRESLRLTHLDLEDFGAKVRERLRRRDPSLKVAVED